MATSSERSVGKVQVWLGILTFLGGAIATLAGVATGALGHIVELKDLLARPPRVGVFADHTAVAEYVVHKFGPYGQSVKASECVTSQWRKFDPKSAALVPTLNAGSACKMGIVTESDHKDPNSAYKNLPVPNEHQVCFYVEANPTAKEQGVACSAYLQVTYADDPRK